MTIPPTPQLNSAAVGSEEPFQTEQVLTIVGGHFIHDLFTGMQSTLLPLLREKFLLSYTQGAILAAILEFPNIISPLIGYLADRISLRYLVIFAPLVTGLAVSLIGIAPSYGILLGLLFVAGISTAAFHAPSPVMIGRISGKQLGRGMSYFMAGGELGRALAPPMVIWAVGVWTLEGTYRLALISALASAMLYWRLRSIPARSDKVPSLMVAIPQLRRLFLPMIFVILLRSFPTFAILSFLPTYLTEHGLLLEKAGWVFSIYQFAGVAGALIAGPISDRFSRKRVLFVATIANSLLMLAFLQTQMGVLMVSLLIGMGLTMKSASPVLLAMVQNYMPDNRATANGIYLALTFVSRPLAGIMIGLFSDAVSLPMAFLISAMLPLLSLPAIFLLPRS